VMMIMMCIWWRCHGALSASTRIRVSGVFRGFPESI